MADNYVQFSEMLVVPEEKKAEVIAFLTREEDNEYGIPICWEMEAEGLWLHSDGFDEASLIGMVQGVLNIIDREQPFIVNVAYTCSKPRVGEFSGGCYAIWRDKDYYVDPFSAVMDYIKFHSED